MEELDGEAGVSGLEGVHHEAGVGRADGEHRGGDGVTGVFDEEAEGFLGVGVAEGEDLDGAIDGAIGVGGVGGSAVDGAAAIDGDVAGVFDEGDGGGAHGGDGVFDHAEELLVEMGNVVEIELVGAGDHERGERWAGVVVAGVEEDGVWDEIESSFDGFFEAVDLVGFEVEDVGGDESDAPVGGALDDGGFDVEVVVAVGVDGGGGGADDDGGFAGVDFAGSDADAVFGGEGGGGGGRQANRDCCDQARDGWRHRFVLGWVGGDR